MKTIRKNPGWSDFERNLFIIENDREICRICDHENTPGAVLCRGCGNVFRNTNSRYIGTYTMYLYSWEEIEEMRRQYAISVVEELLDGAT